MQALVIIDVQNDYFPGGRSELVGSVEALDRIKAVPTKDLNIMGNCIPAGVVHDTYMAGLNGMFAEIRLTEQIQL